MKPCLRSLPCPQINRDIWLCLATYLQQGWEGILRRQDDKKGGCGAGKILHMAGQNPVHEAAMGCMCGYLPCRLRNQCLGGQCNRLAPGWRLAVGSSQTRGAASMHVQHQHSSQRRQHRIRFRTCGHFSLTSGVATSLQVHSMRDTLCKCKQLVVAKTCSGHLPWPSQPLTPIKQQSMFWPPTMALRAAGRAGCRGPPRSWQPTQQLQAVQGGSTSRQYNQTV